MTQNTQLSAAVVEAIDGEMTGKKWYLSKTFWANVVAGVCVIAQAQWGFVLPVEYQMMAMSAINIGLRKIPSTQVTW